MWIIIIHIIHVCIHNSLDQRNTDFQAKNTDQGTDHVSLGFLLYPLLVLVLSVQGSVGIHNSVDQRNTDSKGHDMHQGTWVAMLHPLLVLVLPLQQAVR